MERGESVRRHHQAALAAVVVVLTAGTMLGSGSSSATTSSSSALSGVSSATGGSPVAPGKSSVVFQDASAAEYSASSEQASVPEYSASSEQASSSGDEATPPWRCAEGDEPRVVTPGVTAPAAPFRGVVNVGSRYDSETEVRTIIILYHSTRDRTNTEIRVEGIDRNGPMQVSADSEGLKLGSNGWVLTFAASCTLEPAEAYRSFSSGGSAAVITIPWGGTPRVGGVLLPADDDSYGSADPGPITFAVNNGLSVGLFDIGTHANGIHIVAGDQVGAYVGLNDLSGTPPERLELIGGSRVGGVDPGWFLLGTDGELLAFAYWPWEPAWAPIEITVLSMRTGEVVGCGISGWGSFLLISPPDGGVLVSDIKLPPSGWLNRRGDACPRGLGSTFFEYLAAQPLPGTPQAERAPRPISLPSQRAPAASFQGVVRAFTRYDPGRYVHDHVVQYYDSRTGEVTEIAFDDIGTGNFGRGFIRDLRVAHDGVVVGRRGDVLLMIPWGAAPEVVAAERLELQQYDFQDKNLEPVIDGISRCDSESLKVRRDRLIASLRTADYDGRGRQPRLLELSIGGATGQYLLASPIGAPSEAVEVSTKCGGLGDYYKPRLLGTDDAVLLLSYVLYEGESFYSEPDTYLTYMVSLETGAVLACGIEPGYSATVFVSSDNRSESSTLVKFPASGWLDPIPCTDATSVSLEECTSTFLSRGRESICARELDFQTISEPVDGTSSTAALLNVVAEAD